MPSAKSRALLRPKSKAKSFSKAAAPVAKAAVAFSKAAAPVAKAAVAPKGSVAKAAVPRKAVAKAVANAVPKTVPKALLAAKALLIFGFPGNHT